MISSIFLLILAIGMFLISLFSLKKAKKLTVYQNRQQQQYNEQLQKSTEQLNKKFLSMKHTYLNAQTMYEEQQSRAFSIIKHNYDTWKNEEQEAVNLKVQQIRQQANQQIEDINEDVHSYKVAAAAQKEQLTTELQKFRSSLNAANEQRRRDQEKKNKINYYKLTINDSDLADVEALEKLKPSLHQPVILSKLVWTQYFQKQTTQMCDRILGKKVKCGIYKITDLLTDQVYIGQSVNVADRWKEHVKCGLGIGASATNTLYTTMQKDGVWNFSFQLLQECPRDQLNEKESYWIEMYDSKKFGLNGNKGITK